MWIPSTKSIHSSAFKMVLKESSTKKIFLPVFLWSSLSFASLLSAIGAFAANLGSQGCILLYMDEPKMPRALIEK